jgi:HSP20 family protein
MAQLPARRSARDITLAHPSREFEDIDDRELVISGEISEPQDDEGRRRRRARRTGRFEFRTALPGDISPEGVTANLNDGVLTVMVPQVRGRHAAPRGDHGLTAA